MKRFLLGFGRGDGGSESGGAGQDPNAPSGPPAPGSDGGGDGTPPSRQSSARSGTGVPLPPDASVGSIGNAQSGLEDLQIEEGVGGGGGKGKKVRMKVLGTGKSAFGKIKAGFGGRGGGRRESGEDASRGIEGEIVGEIPTAPAGADVGEEDLYEMRLRQARQRDEEIYGGDGDSGRNSRKNSGILYPPMGSDGQHPLPPQMPNTPPSAPLPRSDFSGAPGGSQYPPYPIDNTGQQLPQQPVPQGPGADDFAAMAYGLPKRQTSQPRGFGVGGGPPTGYNGGGGGIIPGHPNGPNAQPVGWGNVFGDGGNSSAMGPGFTVKPVYRPPPPVFEVAPEIVEKLKRAQYHAAEALSQDEKANYGQAQECYMNALGILIPAIKQLESGKTTARREQEKQKATRLAKQILSRCEAIKPFVEANATVAALEASSAPKTMPSLPSNGDTDDGDGHHHSPRRRRHAGIDAEAWSSSGEDEDVTTSAEDANAPPPPPPPPDSFEDEELLHRISNMISPADKAASVKSRGIAPSKPAGPAPGTPKAPTPQRGAQTGQAPTQRQPPPLPPRTRNTVKPDLSETNGKWECGICTTCRADTMTKCRHLYCSSCINASLLVLNQCPACDAPCAAADLVKVPPPDS